MDLTRRQLLVGAAAGSAALATAAYVGTQPGPGSAAPSRPARLRRGDLVALVAPAKVTYDRDTVRVAAENLEALGLRVRVGEHVLSRYGYLAGRDHDRAADINAAFADDEIRGVVALRGGWGAARALPYVDFDAIAGHPKVVLGYSDITSLLNALYARSNLVGFHGPNGISPWTEFATREMRRVVFDAETPLMRNPRVRHDTLAVREYRTHAIVPGRARGRLVGGNLTLLAALAGTPYFPDATGAIVFLEERGEYIYRCDRMLTQLALAGVFEKAAGVVLGGFTDCERLAERIRQVLAERRVRAAPGAARQARLLRRNDRPRRLQAHRPHRGAGGDRRRCRHHRAARTGGAVIRLSRTAAAPPSPRCAPRGSPRRSTPCIEPR